LITEQNGKVDFLGFELSEKESTNTGKRYIHCQPSKKSQQKFRDKIKGELHHYSTWRDVDDVVTRVNRITRGWGNYFHHGHSQHSFRAANYWLKERLRKWLDKKHKVRGSRSRYSAFPDKFLQDQLGLYLLPSQPKWSTR